MSTRTETTAFAGCCCPPGTCDCGCCAAGYWSEWALVAAGITVVGVSPPCAQCELDRAAAINGTFRLKYRGTCNWNTDELSGNQPDCDLPPDHPKWSLLCDGAYWYLVDDIHTFALYRVPVAAFNCFDEVTFSLDPGYVADGCVTYPATMTLTPAGVFVPC